jgi:hypothetical protein
MGSAIDRVVKKVGDPDVVRKLASELTAPDFTTLMMAVAAERASHVRGSDVLARYRSDRFSRPGTVQFRLLRDIEDLFIRAVPENWDFVVPSPLVPFGTHVALGEISQDWVVTTIRPHEAAADPTVALALEAAARRRDSSARRNEEPQRLATIQRIVRAQLYQSPKSFSHFSIFALATAGRSRPREEFDPVALNEHLAICVAALSEVADSVEIIVSTADTRPGRELVDSVRDRWQERPDVAVTEDPQRLLRQRYYRRACFKINAIIGTETVEIGDGGFTDWTQRMLEDRHERLLISGVGLDRPALALGVRSNGTQDR